MLVRLEKWHWKPAVAPVCKCVRAAHKTALAISSMRRRLRGLQPRFMGRLYARRNDAPSRMRVLARSIDPRRHSRPVACAVPCAFRKKRRDKVVGASDSCSSSRALRQVRDPPRLPRRLRGGSRIRGVSSPAPRAAAVMPSRVVSSAGGGGPSLISPVTTTATYTFPSFFIVFFATQGRRRACISLWLDTIITQASRCLRVALPNDSPPTLQGPSSALFFPLPGFSRRSPVFIYLFSGRARAG